VQRVLRILTAARPGGKSLLERWFLKYDNPSLSRWDRLKWALPNQVIDMALRRAKVNRETMKQKLFHHVPTVKSLTLAARSIGKYGLTTPQRFCAPLFVVWNFTQMCNLTCEHCYQDATRKPAEGELTLDERLDAVDQMGDLTVPFVAFAGGEPLSSKDIWPVMERCRKREIHMSVATNGTLLTPERVARLIECGVKYIEVSIDSLDPDEHDRFRGAPGAWARSIQGIRNCVAAGMRTGMAMCFTRQTVARAEEAIEFAIDLGCATFSHFNFIPVGRGRGVPQHDVTPEQRERLLRLLTEYLQEGRINVISTAPQIARACIMYGASEGMFLTGHAGAGPGSKTMVLARYVGGCGTGRCYCAIQPTGLVTPCVYIRSEIIGDLRRSTLAEIWDHPLCRHLSDRDNLKDNCGVCKYRPYCGGCRARALSYTGDLMAGDPGCIYNAKQWEALAATAGGAGLVRL
jgi:radical SAM protein with 4Fe4S-binding SPASM domain